MGNIRTISEREMEVVGRALKEGARPLSLPALAKHKAQLRTRLESPELSKEERLRTERHLAEAEKAEQRLLECQSKQAPEPGSTTNREDGSKGERAQIELEDLWRFADEGPRSKGTLSPDEMKQAKARRQW
jgi:hypothetical protein